MTDSQFLNWLSEIAKELKEDEEYDKRNKLETDTLIERVEELTKRLRSLSK